MTTPKPAVKRYSLRELVQRIDIPADEELIRASDFDAAIAQAYERALQIVDKRRIGFAMDDRDFDAIIDEIRALITNPR